MRPIDPTLVDEVWREMMSYPVGRIEAEAQAFLTSQPHVAAFARAMNLEGACSGEEPPAPRGGPSANLSRRED